MIRTFISDWRRFGFRVARWNLRFRLGYTILPGTFKHARVSGPEGLRSKTTTGAK